MGTSISVSTGRQQESAQPPLYSPWLPVHALIRSALRHTPDRHRHPPRTSQRACAIGQQVEQAFLAAGSTQRHPHVWRPDQINAVSRDQLMHHTSGQEIWPQAGSTALGGVRYRRPLSSNFDSTALTAELRLPSDTSMRSKPSIGAARATAAPTVARRALAAARIASSTAAHSSMSPSGFTTGERQSRLSAMKCGESAHVGPPSSDCDYFPCGRLSTTHLWAGCWI